MNTSEYINFVADFLIKCCKLNSYLLNDVNITAFNEPVVLGDDCGETTFESTNYTLDQVNDFVGNLLISNLAFIFFTAHESTESFFPEKIKSLSNKTQLNSLESARLFLYLLRCSFVHTPLKPTWDLRSGIYRRININFSDENSHRFTGYFNDEDINGKEIRPEHFGGFQTIRHLLIYLYEEIGKIEMQNQSIDTEI